MIKIFTDSDLDGVVAVSLFQFVYGAESIDVTFTNPYNITEDFIQFVKSGSDKFFGEIFILDLQIKPSEELEALDLERLADKVINIDHHINESRDKYDLIYLIDLNRCTSEIVASYLGGKHPLIKESFYRKMKHLAYLVGLKDLWKINQVVTEEDKIAVCLGIIFNKYSKGHFMACIMYYIGIGEEILPDHLMEEGLNEVDNLINQALKISKKVVSSKVFIPIYNKIYFIYETKGNIYNPFIRHFVLQDTKIDIFCFYNIITKKTYLRTNKEDIDLTLLAKCYGGGGHRKASGIKGSIEWDYK